MLAIETQPPQLFKKKSIFRRLTRKERPLVISSPIMDDVHQAQQAQSPPRSPQRSSNKGQLESTPESGPSLPGLDSRPKKPTQSRVDSASFPDLPISQPFSYAHGASPASSQHSRRPSTDSTCSSRSRVAHSAHPTSPFSQPTLIGAWDLFLPPSHVHALYTGLSPAHPAHQCFVFSEGPDPHGKLKVHFHRAGTGVKLAELFVVMDLKGEGAGKIVGIKWDGSEQTGRMSEEDAKRAVRRCCKGALGVELEGEEF